MRPVLGCSCLQAEQSSNSPTSLIHTHLGKQSLHFFWTDRQLTSFFLQISDLIECAEQPHLHRRILLRINQLATMTLFPPSDRPSKQENTDRERRFPVRGYIEHKFRCRLMQRRAAADEIVLVHISRFPSIGLDASDGHGCGVAIARPYCDERPTRSK